ncbi:Ubiquinone biosynthesis protein coq9, mitochondrial [Podochytrium sp. JEL0797]|nr:Ubiquinone biosynthesis protein coq9, mitochondrial [Podochytrium sp. JEL0797]
MFSRITHRAFTSATNTPAPDVSRIVFPAMTAAASAATRTSSTNNNTQADAILAAALSEVPRLGFTTAALRHGCVSLGLSPMAAGAWPRGGAELAEHFVKTSTEQLSRDMQSTLKLDTMRVPQKIKAGVLMRLDMLKPYLNQWPDALALMAMPSNAPHSLKNLSALVDEIWFVAGDRSTDMNWYSKRVMLAGVYTSTELFMTQDKSPNFVETEKFLDRRLANVAFIGRTTGEVGKIVDFGVKSALGVLASRGFRV